jgi:hypothetical protein
MECAVVGHGSRVTGDVRVGGGCGLGRKCVDMFALWYDEGIPKRSA